MLARLLLIFFVHYSLLLSQLAAHPVVPLEFLFFDHVI